MLVRSQAGNWDAPFGIRVAGSSKDRVGFADYFRIGSNTKTMTGTIVLQLVGEGRLTLQEPVSRVAPEVPNGENITLAQVLDMTSGLFNYTEDAGFDSALAQDPTRVWTPQEELAIAFSHPPYFPPGKGFHYSNTNYILLGQIIERVTGRSLAENLRERIFVPLALGDTSWPLTAEIPVPHPQGYADSRSAAPFLDVTDTSPTIGGAAGQVISTAPDVARYVKALADGTLLPPAVQAARLASVGVLNSKTKAYGLGWARFGTLLGHDGAFPGFNSFMGHDPQNDLTIVVWTSLEQTPGGISPAVTIAQFVYNQLVDREAVLESFASF